MLEDPGGERPIVWVLLGNVTCGVLMPHWRVPNADFPYRVHPGVVKCYYGSGRLLDGAVLTLIPHGQTQMTIDGVLQEVHVFGFEMTGYI